jgi:hypothetical protein
VKPRERIDLWRADAAVLRRRGARRTAALMERLASELEEDLDEGPVELVDLARAVELSGFTRGHLRRRLKEGALVNHGTPDTPLLRVGDLPRKASRPLPSPRPAAASSRRVALMVAGRV